MKTLNRPTASATATAQITALTRAARQLWATEPRATLRERESLRLRLATLEADLERLSLRRVGGFARDTDDHAIRRCAERLLRLEHRWNVDDRPSAEWKVPQCA